MIQEEKKLIVRRTSSETEMDRETTQGAGDFMDSIILDFILKNIKQTNMPLKSFMNQFEERIIITSLKISNGNQRVAARLLGVGHTTLNEKIKKYKINKQYVKIDLIKNIQRDFRDIIDFEKIN